MAKKIRPCLGGIVKHSWSFVGNVEVTKRHSNGDVSFTLKGRYRCRNCCGAHKYGAIRHDVTPPSPNEQEAPNA